MSELLIAGQTNDEILQSLSYKLAPTSEYIQQRRMSRFYPSGASSYSSNTSQIARIELKGQGGFLDLSTLKIAYRLTVRRKVAAVGASPSNTVPLESERLKGCPDLALNREHCKLSS